MSLGERIAKIRRSKGISQVFIAGKLNKTSAWLSNIENGRREIGAEELHQIAEVMGVNIGIFFKDELNDTFSSNLNLTGS